jgi:hypothetical protein
MTRIKAFISRIQEVYIENPLGLCEYSIYNNVIMDLAAAVNTQRNMLTAVPLEHWFCFVQSMETCWVFFLRYKPSGEMISLLITPIELILNLNTL